MDYCLGFFAKVWKANAAQVAQEAGRPSTLPFARPVWKDEPRRSTLQRGQALHTLAGIKEMDPTG